MANAQGCARVVVINTMTVGCRELYVTAMNPPRRTVNVGERVGVCCFLDIETDLVIVGVFYNNCHPLNTSEFWNMCHRAGALFAQDNVSQTLSQHLSVSHILTHIGNDAM